MKNVKNNDPIITYLIEESQTDWVELVFRDLFPIVEQKIQEE